MGDIKKRVCMIWEKEKKFEKTVFFYLSKIPDSNVLFDGEYIIHENAIIYYTMNYDVFDDFGQELGTYFVNKEIETIPDKIKEEFPYLLRSEIYNNKCKLVFSREYYNKKLIKDN